MNQDEFKKICDELDKVRLSEMESKRKEYTQGSPDVHNNFIRVGAAVGVTPKQCWAVYAGKHWDAILNWTKGGDFGSEEPARRFGDLINYLYLGYAYYVRNQSGGPTLTQLDKKYFTYELGSNKLQIDPATVPTGTAVSPSVHLCKNCSTAVDECRCSKPDHIY